MCKNTREGAQERKRGGGRDRETERDKNKPEQEMVCKWK